VDVKFVEITIVQYFISANCLYYIYIYKALKKIGNS